MGFFSPRDWIKPDDFTEEKFLPGSCEQTCAIDENRMHDGWNYYCLTSRYFCDSNMWRKKIIRALFTFSVYENQEYKEVWDTNF